jgi:hypothetical protein
MTSKRKREQQSYNTTTKLIKYLKQHEGRAAKTKCIYHGSDHTASDQQLGLTEQN